MWFSNKISISTLHTITIGYVFCNVAIYAFNNNSANSKNESIKLKSFCSTFNNDKCNDWGNHSCVRNTIQDWWKQIGKMKPMHCCHKSAPLPKSAVCSFLPKTQIKSHPCTEGIIPPNAWFNGAITHGHLEGGGKLNMLLDKNSWLEKHDKIKSNNVCYILSGFGENQIMEIIGNFKNGSLHGWAKITLQENVVHISQFRNGVAHGFQRQWDSSGNLIYAGLQTKGLKMGVYWSYEFGHLLYRNQGPIASDQQDTLAFAFSEAGDLLDPLVGKYLPHLRTLQDVYKPELHSVISNISDCLLNIEYVINSRMVDYHYMLMPKLRIPLNNHKTSPLCTLGFNTTKTSNVSDRLWQWFNTLSQMSEAVYDKNAFGALKWNDAYRLLWHMSPEDNSIDEPKSLRLVSDVKLDPRMVTATARILGSLPIRISFSKLAVDKNNMLHGYCDFSVLKEDYNLVPRDKTLGWPIHKVIGHFVHGKLNGITMVKTNTMSSGWLTVKNGILHGPVVLYGLHPILPVFIRMQLLILV